MRHQMILETESETNSWLPLQDRYNQITISYISVFVSSWQSQDWRNYVQGHIESLWRWPLTCDPEKCYLLRSSLGMYDLERRLRYSNLLTRQFPCNLLPEPTFPKHKYRGQLSGHSVTSWMMSSSWNIPFEHNLGCSFHILVQIEAVFNISKFSKWPPFFRSRQTITGSHSVTSSMMLSPWNILFWHNLGWSFHMWGQIEAMFNFQKF